LKQSNNNPDPFSAMPQVEEKKPDTGFLNDMFTNLIEK
jgi:hypothetical protein